MDNQINDLEIDVNKNSKMPSLVIHTAFEGLALIAERNYITR